MCGIVGYKAFGKQLPRKQELERLLRETQYRGTDATGIAYIEDDRLQIFKQEGLASKFIETKQWKKIKVPRVMIMHCRAKTQGTEKNNKNNHPIFNKQGMALIHNGIISNDGAIARDRGFKLDGQVDSEVILKLIEDGWWGSMKNVNELSGSYACAALYKEKPDELILFRHTSPIHYYIDVARDILFFASTDDILEDAFQNWHRGFATKEIKCFKLLDDTAYLIDKDGLKDDVSLSPKSYTWSSTQRRNTEYLPNHYTGGSNLYDYTKKCDKCEEFPSALRWYKNFYDSEDLGRYLCRKCYNEAVRENAGITRVSKYTCPYCKQDISEQINDIMTTLKSYSFDNAIEYDGWDACDHCNHTLKLADIKAE